MPKIKLNLYKICKIILALIIRFIYECSLKEKNVIKYINVYQRNVYKRKMFIKENLIFFMKLKLLIQIFLTKLKYVLNIYPFNVYFMNDQK